MQEENAASTDLTITPYHSSDTLIENSNKLRLMLVGFAAISAVTVLLTIKTVWDLLLEPSGFPALTSHVLIGFALISAVLKSQTNADEQDQSATMNLLAKNQIKKADMDAAVQRLGKYIVTCIMVVAFAYFYH